MLHGAETAQKQFGLLPDPHASHHILAADGDGAQAILDLLAESRADLNGRITIVYADTAPDASDFALRLCKQDVDRVLVMPTLLAAIGLLSAMIEAARIGARIYAAGSETMIGLVIQLAEARGLDPMSVMAEQRPAASEP
jgi:NADPH-dependent ferric siderophore reductase